MQNRITHGTTIPIYGRRFSHLHAFVCIELPLGLLRCNSSHIRLFAGAPAALAHTRSIERRGKTRFYKLLLSFGRKFSQNPLKADCRSGHNFSIFSVEIILIFSSFIYIYVCVRMYVYDSSASFAQLLFFPNPCLFLFLRIGY